MTSQTGVGRSKLVQLRFAGRYGLLLTLAIAPAGATAKDKSEPAHVVGNPAGLFDPSAYPPEAIKAGEQGRTVVNIAVGARAMATGCTTITSSGSTSLDARTCAIAMTSLHFAAARDSRGRAVAGNVTFKVRWVLPAEQPQLQPPPQMPTIPPVIDHGSTGAASSGWDVVTISGTADAPVCTVTIGNSFRHMIPNECRSLAATALSHGERFGGRTFTHVPDRFLLPPGE